MYKQPVLIKYVIIADMVTHHTVLWHRRYDYNYPALRTLSRQEVTSKNALSGVWADRFIKFKFQAMSFVHSVTRFHKAM